MSASGSRGGVCLWVGGRPLGHIPLGHTPLEHGQQAGDTHPTIMLSCYTYKNMSVLTKNDFTEKEILFLNCVPFSFSTGVP